MDPIELVFGSCFRIEAFDFDHRPTFVREKVPVDFVNNDEPFLISAPVFPIWITYSRNAFCKKFLLMKLAQGIFVSFFTFLTQICVAGQDHEIQALAHHRYQICGSSERTFLKKQTIKYSPEELIALDAYSHESYSLINEFLRNGTIQARKEEKRLAWEASAKQYIEGLDLVFARLKPLPCGITVYRGLRLKPSQIPNIGEVFIDKAYMSTSYDFSVAHRYSDHNNNDPLLKRVVLKIHLAEGSRVLFMNTVYQQDPSDDNSEEEEILIPREKKFKVRSERMSGLTTYIELIPVEN